MRNLRSRHWITFALVLVVLIAVAVVTLRVRSTVPPAEALAAGRTLLAARTVLVVAAHPDDVEWYVGGTLRVLADRGARVHVIIATNGERGPNRTGTPDLPATRRAEQLEAARVNGYAAVHFLDLPDRGVTQASAFLPRVQQIMRDVRPDAVLAFDAAYPSLPYLHPDHQGSARRFLAYWQGLGADRPDVYLFQTRRPNVAVDITRVIDVKVDALARHRSQNGGSGERVRTFYGGRAYGVPYAETYRKLP